MFPIPGDPREPQLEIVPTDTPDPEREKEDQFWRQHSEVPVEEILKNVRKRKQPKLN